jgi:hypothetical protein
MSSDSVDPVHGSFVRDVAATSTEDSCCRGTDCCGGQKSFAPLPEKTPCCNDEEDACCGEKEEMPCPTCDSGNGEEVKPSCCRRGDDEDPCKMDNCCDDEEVDVKENPDDSKLTNSRISVQFLLLLARFRLHVLHQRPHQ